MLGSIRNVPCGPEFAISLPWVALGSGRVIKASACLARVSHKKLKSQRLISRVQSKEQSYIQAHSSSLQAWNWVPGISALIGYAPAVQTCWYLSLSFPDDRHPRLPASMLLARSLQHRCVNSPRPLWSPRGLDRRPLPTCLKPDSQYLREQKLGPRHKMRFPP